MKIADYIESQFLQRVESHTCLVIYDPTERYRDLAKGLADERVTVVDASDSIILGRERAMEAWIGLGKATKQPQHLVVYVPAKTPESEEEKCRDPFQIFALGGAAFPDGDGDTYLSLCRRAKPDHAAKIEVLFKAGTPDFTTIDNVGSGHDWPKLRSLLGVDSAVELAMALLAPNEAQRTALTADDTWVDEYVGFASAILGCKIATKKRKWEAIRDESWRFVLFSEFVLDLPGGLPANLSGVPRGDATHQDIIFAICQELRDSVQHQPAYMEMAEKVATDMKLETEVKDIQDLGQLDTFAFEERSFLNSFAKSALAGKLGPANAMALARKNSVWVRNTPRQSFWTIAERALALITKAGDMSDEFATVGKGLGAIVDFYVARGHLLDTLHREFEQAVGDAYGDLDCLEPLVEHAREGYRKFVEQVQERFVSGVQTEGWPLSGRTRNTEVFDRFITPTLKERKRRVAFFMVDALRFELGVVLQKKLKDDACTLEVVCAQLPTVTAVGMASLLPEAETHLRLAREVDKLIPTLKDRKIENPPDRLAYVKSIYGDGCDMIDLEELLALPTGKKKPAIQETVRLLIVKTTEIDGLAERNPAKARELIPRILQEIVAGITKLKRLGFEEAVIGTDHGFVLLHGQAAGDTLPKPAGDWLKIKDRSLLGSGSASPGTVLFPKEQVGIRGDFATYAVPRSFATFSARIPYFHEGLSLQECVIPALRVLLSKEMESATGGFEVQMSYKGGKTNQITTRRPMIDLSVFKQGLFQADQIEVRLEAWAKKPSGSGERIVGEPASSEPVNPATGNVRITPGQAIKVPLKMDEDFTGSFELRVLDPETRIAHAAPLTLKTNYLE
jgi:PglZ domain